ncbi:hypothetical protein SAMN02745163_01157 [Clostridium cavendishii DSM 21758]|uniref:Uncharacterized protein n=1 Tax=Clostridium cavendishii DSM 21758 TaxID=1121302 RepID=A0A1M6FJP1_9CLOT|nr:hypothetical protein SAMN02745163_01157 [Clostridium cavendishii DSM 21758]
MESHIENFIVHGILEIMYLDILLKSIKEISMVKVKQKKNYTDHGINIIKPNKKVANMLLFLF